MTDFENDVTASLEVLRTGGLILYPTDTIWGIGCDATDEAAVKRIFALKQRPESKSLVILLADVRDLLKYVANPHPETGDMIAGFDRPTTIIYEGALGLAPSAVNEDGTVAIRIVQEPFCRHLVKRLRKPLISTSANISGQPSPASFKDIDPIIKNGVDYAVNYRQTENTASRPSRIIKMMKDGSIQVIRE